MNNDLFYCRSFRILSWKIDIILADRLELWTSDIYVIAVGSKSLKSLCCIVYMHNLPTLNKALLTYLQFMRKKILYNIIFKASTVCIRGYNCCQTAGPVDNAKTVY